MNNKNYKQNIDKNGILKHIKYLEDHNIYSEPVVQINKIVKKNQKIINYLNTMNNLNFNFDSNLLKNFLSALEFYQNKNK